MDQQYGKVSSFSIAAILFLSSGMINHVLAIPVILDVAGRDSWISVLIAAPFFIIWLMLLFKFIDSLNGKPFIEWVQEKWGRLGKLIFILLSIGFLFFNVVHTLVDTVIWTVSTYMHHTPYMTVGLAVLLVCILLAYNGLQSIAVTAGILFPLVSIFGFLVSFVNNKHKDMTMLLPIFEHSYNPALLGALYVFIALCDCWMIVLFANEFKQHPSKKFKWGFGLFSILICIGPLIGGITEFGPTEATLQRYTVFDQWKIFSLGRLLQHVDFLSIFQWLSGALIRIALSIYLIMKLLPIRNQKSKLYAYAGFFLILTGTMLFKWRSDLMLIFLQDYYFPAFYVYLLVFTILIAITQLIASNRSKRRLQLQPTINTERGETDNEYESSEQPNDQ